MAHCVSCGFDNPVGMRFCGQCGARLGEPGPAPASPQPAASFSPERFGVMMGTGLLKRFRQAGLEAAGQRRVVTVLFVDISGFSTLSTQLETEDLYTLIQQTLAALAKCVYNYDGVVDKFTGDGLMALFGAPIAHEDNAELAVRAALDMQAAAAQLGAEVRQKFGEDLTLHIGLHSGPVVVGSIGSDLLMNYTAIGDTVNLARRLEETAARGTIVASESVYQQTRAVADFEPLPLLPLKGFPRAVPAFRVLGLKPQPGMVRGVEGLRAPLVGRDAEFNRLKKALNALVTQDQGRFVMITGEGGIGKSRLTRELKGLIAGSNVRIVEGRSLTYRRAVPYWTFQDAFRNYLEVGPDAGAAQLQAAVGERLAEVLGPAAAEVQPYLEHWLSLPPSDPDAAERLRYLEPGQLRRQVFVALRDVWAAAARRRPLWVILEDLHWADDASLELLLFLLETIPQVPLLVYAITRPYGDGPLARVAARARELLGERLVEVGLTSLSPDQSERLLFQLLPIAEFPPAWLDAILSRAAGVPYYLEEILRMLIDQEVIQYAEGRWRLTAGADPASLAVPETLQALILARFDRLEPADRRVLQAASVIGREFGLALLGEILAPMPEAVLRRSLEQLTEREFIAPEATDDTYNFRHVLVSDAIYGTMLRRVQNDLHGQVGEALEKLYPDQVDKNVEILARHYAFSPRVDRAVRYLILAGQRAARAYLHDQARQHFEQALALLPQAPPDVALALQASTGLGDVLVFAGEYGTARLQYQAALAVIPLAKQGQYGPERAELNRKLGVIYLKQGEYELALEAFAAAQVVLTEAGPADPIAMARIMNDIGRAHFERGDVEAAQANLLAALRLVENEPALDVVASLYNRLGAVAYRRGDWAGAADYIGKSAGIRETIGDLVDLAGSLNNLGLLDIAMGDLNAALAHLGRSLEIKRQLGDTEGLAIGQGNLGYLHITRGELEVAEQVLAESTTTAQQLGLHYLLVQNQRLLGALHVAGAHWEQALSVLEECVQRANESGAQDQLAEVYCLLGEAWLGAGQVEFAGQWSSRAQRMVTGTHLLGPTEERGYLLRLQGMIALERGDLLTAQACLNESLAIFQSLSNRLGEGRLYFQSGRLAIKQGATAIARQHLSAARSILDTVGAKLDADKAARLLADIPD